MRPPWYIITSSSSQSLICKVLLYGHKIDDCFVNNDSQLACIMLNTKRFKAGWLMILVSSEFMSYSAVLSILVELLSF